MTIKSDQHIEAGNERRPKLAFLSLDLITLDLSNPRKHPRRQIRDLAKSMTTYGFTAPILLDKTRKIVAGHGRYEAAKIAWSHSGSRSSSSIT